MRNKASTGQPAKNIVRAKLQLLALMVKVLVFPTKVSSILHINLCQKNGGSALDTGSKFSAKVNWMATSCTLFRLEIIKRKNKNSYV